MKAVNPFINVVQHMRISSELIYKICMATYRLIPTTLNRLSTLSSLRGKRVNTFVILKSLILQ